MYTRACSKMLLFSNTPLFAARSRSIVTRTQFTDQLLHRFGCRPISIIHTSLPSTTSTTTTTNNNNNKQAYYSSSPRRANVRHPDFSTSRRLFRTSAPLSSSPSASSPSSPSPPTTPSLPSTPPPQWVNTLNEALAVFPAETIVSFILLDIAAIGTAYQGLMLGGIDIPTDFALAFGISRLFRRIRTPLDVGVAALLARLYPPLVMVKPTSIFMKNRIKNSSSGSDISQGSAAEAAEAAGTSSSSPSSAIGYFKKAGLAFASVIDTYGLSFLVAQRMFVGLTSVLTIFACLRSGVDVEGWLSSHGFTLMSGAGKIAGTWAAGACIAASVFPGVVIGAGYLGLRLGRLRKRMMAVNATKEK